MTVSRANALICALILGGLVVVGLGLLMVSVAEPEAVGLGKRDDGVRLLGLALVGIGGTAVWTGTIAFAIRLGTAPLEHLSRITATKAHSPR